MSFSGATTDEIFYSFAEYGIGEEESEALWDWMTDFPSEGFRRGLDRNDEGIETLIFGFMDAYDPNHELVDIDQMLEDDIDLFVPMAPPGGRTGKRIGCDYRGVKDIKEKLVYYHKDNLASHRKKGDLKVYIPPSVDCIYSVYQKYFDLVGDDIDFMGTLSNARKKSNKSGVTINAINKDLKFIDRKSLPTYKVWVQDGVVKYSSKSDKTPLCDYCVGLLFLGDGFYHAVLICAPTPARANLLKSDIEMELFRTKELKCSTTFCRNEKFKIPHRYAVVYDIETYTSDVPNPLTEAQKRRADKLKKQDKNIKYPVTYPLIPVSLGWALVDLADGAVLHYNFESEYDEWTNLYMNMLRDIKSKIDELSLEVRNNSIQLFAHNGSRFDNIYARLLPGVKIHSAIRAGNQFKSIDLILHEQPDFKYIFKDTCPFTLASYKKSCLMFGTELCKMDFDIVGKSKEWFRENDSTLSENKDKDIPDHLDHMKYLYYDVIPYADLLYKLDTMTKSFGMSITTFLGLPGMSYYLLRRSCLGMRDMRIPSDPSICRFIKDSIYGGRVMQWKTKFPSDNPVERELHSSKLISIDLNSLYPSSMFMASFPYGEPYLLKPHELNIESLVDLEKITNIIPHFIIECTIKIPNVKYAYHPYKKELLNSSKERISTVLIYPSNTTIRGVYNDVDLREMIRDGYEVTAVHRGIKWLRSRRIFSDLIEVLYNKRYEYKAMLKSEDPEVRNAGRKEYMIKILLNAMYGKFNETIRDNTKYLGDDYKLKIGTEKVRSHKLPNDQNEVIIKNFHEKFNKPTQVAGYILSYSRALVNEIIRTVNPRNIYYSDTDSLYIPLNIYTECVDKNLFGGMVTDSKLCGFKNDYGDNVYITEAIFLDIKRYYLKKAGPGADETSVTLKFNGLNFAGLTGYYSMISTTESDFKAVNNRDKDYYDIANKLYNMFYVNKLKYNDVTKKGVHMVFDALKKDKIGIHSIEKNILFGVTPDKRINVKYIGDYVELSALGYNYDEEEAVNRYYSNGYECSKKVICGSLQAEESLKKKTNISINLRYDLEGGATKALLHVKSKSLPIYEVPKKHNCLHGGSSAVMALSNEQAITNYYMLNDGKNTILYKEEAGVNDDNYYVINAFGAVNIYNITEKELEEIKPVVMVCTDDKDEYSRTHEHGYNYITRDDYIKVSKLIKQMNNR